MRNCTVTEYISVGEICLDERNFFDASGTRTIFFGTSTKSFEARNDSFPGVLWQLFRCYTVRSNDKLYENI
jgi:hypothetical protein